MVIWMITTSIPPTKPCRGRGHSSPPRPPGPTLRNEDIRPSKGAPRSDAHPRHLGSRLGVRILVDVVVLFSLVLIVFVAFDIYHETRVADALGARKDQIATLRKETLGLHFLHGMATILVFAVGIHFIVRRRVTAPIAQMVLAVKHFRLGAWSPRLPRGGRDEIDWLADNLRDLGPHLEQNIASFIAADRKSIVARISLTCDRQLISPARRIQTLARTMSTGSGDVWAWSEVEESITRIVNELETLGDLESTGMQRFVDLEQFPGGAADPREDAE